MRRFAVLAQRLPVVGGHDDPGCLPFPRRQRVEQPTESVVDVGNLVVVGLRVAPPERCRSLVRIVRVEHVHPEKERSVAAPRQPAQCRVDDLIGPPFGVPLAPVGRRAGHRVVVKVETASQSERVVQRVAADEGRGRPAARGKFLRDGGHVVRQGVADVVAHTVMLQAQPGQDRGVGRQGQWRRRVNRGEAVAPCGNLPQARHRAPVRQAICT